MYLSHIEIEKIARLVVNQLKTAGLKLSNEQKVSTTVANVINKNMEEERLLEDDARKLFKQHSHAMGSGLDQEKALQMIKRKLADERKFVL